MKARSFVLGSIALLAIGCTGGSGGEQGSNTPTNAPTPSSKTLKVALLTPGPVNDNGWCAMAYDGLNQIKDKLGAEVNNQEAKDAQIKDAFRSYAQKGYNIIFGHGFEYYAPAAEVAKDFPNTTFIASSGAGPAPANVGAFRFYLEQSFYLCGYMAASMSKSGKVAMIGGDNVPSIKSTFKAFRAGAEAANPKITVIEIFTGDGQDVAKAKQATESAITQGADGVIHQANAAAKGVFEACKEHKVWAYGANMNQNDDPSGVVIASGIITAGPAFLDLATQIRDGKFKGGISLMGMDKGAIDFVINPALIKDVPEGLVKKLDDLKGQIKSGALVVPKDEF